MARESRPLLMQAGAVISVLAAAACFDYDVVAPAARGAAITGQLDIVDRADRTVSVDLMINPGVDTDGRARTLRDDDLLVAGVPIPLRSRSGAVYRFKGDIVKPAAIASEATLDLPRLRGGNPNRVSIAIQLVLRVDPFEATADSAGFFLRTLSPRGDASIMEQYWMLSIRESCTTGVDVAVIRRNGTLPDNLLIPASLYLPELRDRFEACLSIRSLYVASAGPYSVSLAINNELVWALTYF
jgi:hypothetical protein